jgi:hypothetical protein
MRLSPKLESRQNGRWLEREQKHQHGTTTAGTPNRPPEG